MERIPEEFERGEQQSAADIASGHPKLFLQTRGSWGELLMRLMADRFEVAVQHISDMTTQAEVSYREGYNHTTAAHIDELSGVGSCRSVFDEVDRYRKLQSQRYLEPKDQGS